MTHSDRFRFLIAGFSLVTLLALGGYWQRLEVRHQQMRADTLARTEQVAGQLAGGVSEQMAAVVRSVDFVVENLRSEQAEGVDSLNQAVRSAYATFPPGALLQVGVIDADGFLSYSNLDDSGRVDLSDREHFRVHADQPEQDALFISRPVFGRVSKLWAIQFTRPIRHAGKFAGVLVLSISPHYLSTTLESLGLGPNDSAALLRADGSFLARSSRLNEYLGQRVKRDRPYLLADSPVSGVFHDRASLEPIVRTFAWHRLPSSPLIVYVGLSEADILRPVEQEIQASRQANTIGCLLVLAFAAAIVLLLFRVERQRHDLIENEALYRGLFEKNASVKLLVDPAAGRIVAANPAACRYYGYPRNVLEGLPIGEINVLSPECLAEEMAKARQERRSHFYFSHRLASGEIRQVEVYSGPLERGGKTLLYSIVHDVTERSLLENRLKASELRYRTVFEAIPNGMILVDAKQEIVLWNSAALAILRVDEAGLKSRRVNLSHRDGRAVKAEDYPTRRAIEVPSSQGLFALSEADGSKRWIAVNTQQLPPAADGQVTGAVVSFSDISRLIALEESLLISQSVFEVASEGIMVTDADNRIVRVNPAFTRITGYRADDVQGQSPSILASGQHDAAFYRAIDQSLADKGRWEGETVNRRKDGRLFVEWLKIAAVTDRDGVLLRYVALFSDITVKKEQERDIWHRAHYDPLTELPNRTLFLDRLKQSLAQAVRRALLVGLLFVDLDKFKPVNDTYGHQAGDELLRQVARRIASCLRDEDTVARIGGDEFVVLLPAMLHANDCLTVADKILESLMQPFGLGEVTVEISASIGLALSPENGSDAEALIRYADQAMYQAKAAGRSTIR